METTCYQIPLLKLIIYWDASPSPSSGPCGDIGHLGHYKNNWTELNWTSKKYIIKTESAELRKTHEILLLV